MDSPATAFSARLTAFRQDLVAESSNALFDKYIIKGHAAALTQSQESRLLEEAAKSFETPVDSVLVVGSAKLGFRLHPKLQKNDCNAKAQFSYFDDDSDVDLAIVSPALFERYWKRVYDFFKDGGYAASTNFKKPRADFRRYLEQGWIRPDALPGTGKYDQRAEWRQRVDQINRKRVVQQRVSLGLYFDRYFLAGYQSQTIEKCKQSQL